MGQVGVTTIVRLAPNDWARLRTIRIRALRDAPDAFSSTADDAETRTPENWSRQLEDLPTWIAAIDGSDVGMVRGAPDDDDDDSVWLISMWVAPEARRCGVGGRLIDAVAEWAGSVGARRVLLDVADLNAAAIALYKAKDFRATGRRTSLPPPRDHIGEHQLELKLR